MKVLPAIYDEILNISKSGAAFHCKTIPANLYLELIAIEQLHAILKESGHCHSKWLSSDYRQCFHILKIELLYMFSVGMGTSFSYLDMTTGNPFVEAEFTICSASHFDCP